jgi:hypothetical protein
MLPDVCRLDRVEMIRDGGSFAATFENDCGARYILFIPIRTVKDGDRRRRLGYDPPLIIDCDPKKRPANTDRVRYSELCGPKIPISWADARGAVDAITRLANGLDSFGRHWLGQMAHIAATEGMLPPDLSDNG